MWHTSTAESKHQGSRKVAGRAGVPPTWLPRGTQRTSVFQTNISSLKVGGHLRKRIKRREGDSWYFYLSKQRCYLVFGLLKRHVSENPAGSASDDDLGELWHAHPYVRCQDWVYRQATWDDRRWRAGVFIWSGRIKVTPGCLQHPNVLSQCC